MNIDFNNIYDIKTRQYFQEIMSSYYSNNFRSVIVLLNSVCLCDLFYKLQELRDIYSDTKARNILNNIENIIQKDRTSPAWEKKLVYDIYSETHLLDSSGFILLNHLHDYRNLTSHPVLDGSSKLYQPSKELVESCIIEAFNSILTKPSIFVKEIVSFMSEDLSSKKGYLLDDTDGFKKYIDQKYLRHMDETMVLKVFKAFWKFTFISINDDCNDNRRINRQLIHYLYNKYFDIINDDIKNNQHIYSLKDDKHTIFSLIIFLAQNPSCYILLHEVTKILIKKNIQEFKDYKLISWFLFNDKKKHIDSLIAENFSYLTSEKKLVIFFENSFIENNEVEYLYKYYIYVLRNCCTFNTVISQMDDFIIPNLKNMSKERLKDLLQCFEDNSQIYWNYCFNGYCGRVWEYAKKYYTKEYIMHNYLKFKFPPEI